MKYKQKIDKILREQAITPARLAEQLGITARTLSDFMRDDGREPSGAVARLLDLMAGETRLGGQFLKTRRLLVAVHKDFVKDASPLEVIDGVSRYAEMSVSTSADEDFISSERHFVTVAPSAENAWAVLDSLKSRNIQPHFLSTKNPTDSMLDCYFAAVIMWQISRLQEGTLSDVVLAADFDKFFFLARYIKEVSKANVIFAFHTESDIDTDKLNTIKDSGIISISLKSGRKMGVVKEKYNGYGYIYTDDGERLFFHWNSMNKKDFSFEETPKEARVSFALDKNHKGPCAIDVKIVEFPDLDKPPTTQKKRKTISQDDLCSAIIEAVESCADENGVALTSDVGNRVKIKLNMAVPDILISLGFPLNSKLKDFVGKFPDKFITHDQGNEPTGKHRKIALKK